MQPYSSKSPYSLLDAWEEQEQFFTPSTRSNAVTVFSPVTPTQLSSRKIIQESSLVDPEKDKEMLQEIMNIMRSNTSQMIEMRRRIDEAINEFHEKSKQSNRKFEQFVNKLGEMAEAGQFPTQEELDRHKLVSELSKEVVKRYEFTALTLLELQNSNSIAKLGEYKTFFELMFFQRFQEIELMEKRVDLLIKQENHELTCKIAIHNQALKEEEQYFRQFLDSKEFEAKEKEREFRRGLDERKQSHQETIDFKKLRIEEKKLDFEKLKAENEDEIAQKKIKLEKYRINSEERVRLAEASRKETKAGSSCIIC